MPTDANTHLQTLGAPAFKLWIYLCRLSQSEGTQEFTVALSELSKSSGVVSEEGGAGLGPLRAALRRLVSAQYLSAVPEKERRCRIELIKTVELR